MLDFKPVTPDIKDQYQKLSFSKNRSCLHTLATMFIWGHAKYAVVDGFFVFLAKYGEKYVYPFPVGDGDLKHIIELLALDAKERNIPFKLSGLNNDDVETLKKLFPEKFTFSSRQDYEDYIYLIDDLKNLEGRKFHQKRNHLNKFKRLFPYYTVEEINEKNIPAIWDFASKWFDTRDDEDIIFEKLALRRAFDNYHSLGFEGLALSIKGQIIAFTLASQTSNDTFDVHFEKADTTFDGAYTAINNFFAAYISEKYPFIKYLNREEDMGIQGLRKAKLSYNPHHMQERINATEVSL